MALAHNWAQQILRGLGAPVTAQNLRFLAAWQKAEGGGTANNANFNPLNTTQGASGAGRINSVGVRSYRSAEQGLRATIETLRNGHYGDIVQGLRRNVGANALAHSSSLSTWGTGKGVLRVLGAGGDLSPAAGGGGSSPGLDLAGRLGASGGATAAPQGPAGNPMFAALLQTSNDLAAGHMPNSNDFITALAAQRELAQQPSAPSQQVAGQVQQRGSAGGMRGTGGRGINELFYDPLGAIKYGKGIPAIGGHSDHVHFSLGTEAAQRAAIAQAQRMGLHVGEFNDSNVHPVHVSGSFHYQHYRNGSHLRKAADVSGNANQMAAFYHWVARNYR